MQCYFAFHVDPNLFCKSTLQGDNEDKQCADPIRIDLVALLMLFVKRILSS